MRNEIALEIISKFNINTEIPYSYDGKDYLSAEDVLSEILQKVARTRSCWVVLDNRHEPNQLAEFAGWYDVQDAENEAIYIRNQRDCIDDAIQVVEITLQ